MNILFLSGVIPEQLEDYVIENTTGNVEFAANKYQQLMINGLKSTCSNLTVLNSMFVNSFPRGFKKPYISAFSNVVNKKSAHYSFINTGFLNVFGVRHYSKYRNIKIEVDKWLKTHATTDDNYIIGYSVFGEALDVFRAVKRIRPDVKTCLVVPDLPKYCCGANELYNKYLLHIDEKLMKSKKILINIYYFQNIWQQNLKLVKISMSL